MPTTRWYPTGPMSPLIEHLRIRLMPALVTALGVTLLTAGLLTYTGPVAAGPVAVETPTSVAIDPTASPSPSPLITLPPLGTPLPTDAPTATPEPTATPLVVDPSSKRRATRVRVAALNIDMPVIRPPGGAGAYPLCDVAMYI